MALPLLIGAGAGALAKGLPYIAGALSPEGQAEARQAKEDIEKLRRNEFGPSRAEQERMVQDALAMARAQAEGARAEVQRQQAATGIRTGSEGLATQKITEQASKQAGTLRMGASDTAAQLAAQARKEALARVKARKAETVAAVGDVLEGAALGAAGAKSSPEDWAELYKAYKGGQA